MIHIIIVNRIPRSWSTLDFRQRENQMALSPDYREAIE